MSSDGQGTLQGFLLLQLFGLGIEIEKLSMNWTIEQAVRSESAQRHYNTEKLKGGIANFLFLIDHLYITTV